MTLITSSSSLASTSSPTSSHFDVVCVTLSLFLSLAGGDFVVASSVAPFAFLFVFVLFFSLSLSQSLACHFLLAKQNKYVLAVGITCITYTIRGTTAIYATRMPKKHTHTH